MAGLLAHYLSTHYNFFISHTCICFLDLIWSVVDVCRCQYGLCNRSVAQTPSSLLSLFVTPCVYAFILMANMPFCESKRQLSTHNWACWLAYIFHHARSLKSVLQTLQKTFYFYQRDSFSSIFVSQVVAEYLSLFKLPQESLGGGQGISDNNYSYGFIALCVVVTQNVLLWKIV